MSFSKEKRNHIRFYILEKIESGRKNPAKAASESFGISLNTAYRYIREMAEEGILCKQGSSYVLANSRQLITLRRSEGELTSEDTIFVQRIQPAFHDLPQNILTIWQYAFTEMMNNAIDHSEAESVSVEICRNFLNTALVIEDDGVGIFRKLKDFFGFDTSEEAVRELFKGKLTTDQARHSGEGIFFTSRAVDKFAAVSEGRIFSHDRFDDVVQDFTGCTLMEHWMDMPGTAVFMSLSNFSNKTLKEIFDQYSSVDEGFFRTSIPIKNMFDMFPVARSQARRLCQNFDKFREIELDFEGVEEVGQGFAHELFVVYQNSHPEIRLVPVNTNDAVEKMIRRVQIS